MIKLFNSILLCIVFITLPKHIVAQSVFSSLRIIQPTELEGDYVRGYGSQTIFRGNDAFIQVAHRALPKPLAGYDGLIYYAFKTSTGDWNERPVYPETLNWKYYTNPPDSFPREFFFGQSFDVEDSTLVAGAIADVYDYYGPNRIDYTGSVFVFKQDKKGNWKQTDRIFDNPPIYSDNFGRKVLLYKGLLFVYSIYNKVEKDVDGIVNVYKKDETNTWQLIQQITHPEPENVHGFGGNMVVSKNTLAVFSSRKKDPSSTQFYFQSISFFEFDSISSTWNFVQEVIDTTLNIGAQTLKFHQNQLFVGSPNDRNRLPVGSFESEGSIAIYAKDPILGWYKSAKIYPNEIHPHRFGHSFYIHGNHLFAGAPLHEYDENGSSYIENAGALYVFIQNADKEWQELAKITAPDRNTSHYFGTVSGFENQIIITSSGKADTKPGVPFFLDPLKYFRPSTFYLMNYDSIVSDFLDFKIYPNPASNFVAVELLAFPPKATISLYNLQGQLISQKILLNYNYAEFDLRQLAKGFYLIDVTTTSRSKALKLIKID